jgi:excisionase family DNA binding protein
MEDYMTLQQAAEYSHVTRQAVYKALKSKAIIAEKKGNRWYITKKNLDAYRANKYNRDDRVIDGELVFDMEKGYFSASQVCKIISSALRRPFPMNRLYYLLRTGQLKAFRKRSAWVIKNVDAAALLQSEIDKIKELTNYDRKISD